MDCEALGIDGEDVGLSAGDDRGSMWLLSCWRMSAFMVALVAETLAAAGVGLCRRRSCSRSAAGFSEELLLPEPAPPVMPSLLPYSLATELGVLGLPRVLLPATLPVVPV